jgi:hypothetical protein
MTASRPLGNLSPAKRRAAERAGSAYSWSWTLNPRSLSTATAPALPPSTVGR